MTPRIVFSLILLASCIVCTTTANAQAPLLGKAPTFEKDVLPLLTTNCLKCHGAESKKSGLDLRTPSLMLKGGTNGPVLVKGHADKSLLYELVANKTMPPKEAAKLSDAQLTIIRNWIDSGALTEKPESASVELVSEKDRQFWAFRPPLRPPLPSVKHSERIRTPIDAFILAKLEAKGSTLSPDADRLTLVRRLYFDLIGLPPSPEEIDTYLADGRADAYEQLVDRLLASPHYGERWGRHWLDAAGYSDSVGSDNDAAIIVERDGIWRYRDYVVRSMNADKPFDRFLREQLAGDEMDDWRSATSFTEEMKEHLIATGFLRVAVDHTREDELNRPFERYQVLHDTIESLTSNLLGLTVGCARCHDHKFDPIPQTDYYRLLAVLKPAYNPESWIQPQARHLADIPPPQKDVIDRENAELDRQAAELKKQIDTIQRAAEQRVVEAKMAAIPEAIRADLRAALVMEPAKRSEVQKYLVAKLGALVKVEPPALDRELREQERRQLDALKEQTAKLNGQKRSYGKLQAIWDRADAPPTYLFRRGNHLTLGQEVPPGYFAVLTNPKQPIEIASPKVDSTGTGRRTAWATWLTRPGHPLTARVIINRVWQRYFGEGIVATSDNFGHLGSRPTHPELLDWLAVDFVESGWRLKALHRLIVTSSVYRQTSTLADQPEAQAREQADPGNGLLGRMRLRRLESEAIRDAVLAVSGALDRTPGGPPIPLDPKPDGLVVLQTKGLSPTAQHRRSLYLFARRNYNLTLLNEFDQPVMATNCVRRISSAVPLQSLTLLNDAFMLEQADQFAERVANKAGTERERRIETAFQLALCRKPTQKELAAAVVLLDKSAQRYAGKKLTPNQIEMNALARLCHMLLCTNEFLYVG